MTGYTAQTTLAKSISFSGVGVHSGKMTHLTLRPAPQNHGIKFRRVDLPGTQDIQALFKLVVDP